MCVICLPSPFLRTLNTLVTATTTVHKVLVFNCNQPRSPTKLLAPLVEALTSGKLRLDHAVFCVPKVEQPATDKSNALAQVKYTTTTWQQQIADEWQRLMEGAQLPAQLRPEVHVLGSINAVMRFLEELTSRPPKSLTIGSSGPAQTSYTVEVLVAGSLYLVGAVLEVCKYPTAN